MKYAYYALFSKDDGVWSYAFKEVGGFGVGDDLDDTRKMAKEAIRLNVQWLLEDGEPIPAPTPREIIETEAANDPDYTEWFVELVEVDV